MPRQIQIPEWPVLVGCPVLPPAGVWAWVITPRTLCLQGPERLPVGDVRPEGYWSAGSVSGRCATPAEAISLVEAMLAPHEDVWRLPGWTVTEVPTASPSDELLGLAHRLASHAPDWPARKAFWSAYSLAESVHSGQERLGRPYIHHPVHVCSSILADGALFDADVACAALLHDTVEDCWASIVELWGDADVEHSPAGALEVLAQEVSPRAAELVSWLTNPTTTREPSETDADFTARKRARYAAHVLHVLEAAPAAARIKLADLAANALALHELPPARKEQLAAKYAPVVEAVRRHLGALPEADPLRQTWLEPFRTQFPP